MNKIKTVLKKTLLYNLQLKIRTTFGIYYNMYFSKFKSDSKYKDKNISDTFRQIYKSGEWGNAKELGYDDGQPFFSGTGSYTEASAEYVRFITEYVKKNKIKSIVDLGCGDFNIGKRVTNNLPDVQYLGVDIFDEIVNYNNNKFGSDNVKFKMIDTTQEIIPIADLLLVREVFQHLSNTSINKIAKLQFKGFKFVLVTECHPPTEHLHSYNLDKPDGPGYRCDHGSGVFLDKSPFNFNVNSVLSCPHAYFGDINTYEVKI